MKKIIIFSGTSEGRSLSEALAGGGLAHTVCVATEYGKAVMKEDPLVTVKNGRLTEEEMEALVKEGADIVYDATHPFAKAVTENIKTACKNTGKSYVRILRKEADGISDNKATFFDDAESCAKALEAVTGNILITTGSKEVAVFASNESIRDRLFVRVLPSEESIRQCLDAGISREHIIAMQGPFDKDMNKAIIRQFGISCLVTKESGIAGGYYEKMEACMEEGITAFVLGKGEPEEGIFVEDALKEVGITMPLNISLIGMGPGGTSLLTEEAREEIAKAEVIFGAKRLIEKLHGKTAYPYYLAKDIIPVLEGENIKHAAILFSGDIGFYSGALKMRMELTEWAIKQERECKVTGFPGVSALSYLAARTGEAYDSIPMLSLHGRNSGKDFADIISKIRFSEKTFLIFSGAEDIRTLSEKLVECGLEDAELIIGYELSYPEEEIYRLSAKECLKIEKPGLYAAVIKNPRPEKRRLIPVIADEELIRTDPQKKEQIKKHDAPMTKEMIRHASILRLALSEGDVLFDIGSGTGSVSVEAAALHPSVKVYAIEKKEAAIRLTRLNAEKFSCGNISIVEGEAPEAFSELEAPTHAFIGGSSGRMKDILKALKNYGKEIRVVINAISLETMAEVNEVIKTEDVKDLVIEQLSVSKSRTLGEYHMMTAENPVMIASFILEGA